MVVAVAAPGRRGRRATRLAVVATVALVVGACGGRPGTSTVTPRPSTVPLAATSTLVATTTSAAASTPTASGLDGERRWLEAITTLHTTLDEPFTETFDLTPAKMESLAKVFRGCSRELARLGSPSDRLQPVHALVMKACAHYDKAARCFAAAARYGTPDAGSSEDLTQAQAFNCAAAAHEAGTTLLAEAEEKGFEIWGAPG